MWSGRAGWGGGGLPRRYVMDEWPERGDAAG
jgi:hypothetical protein